MPKKLLRRLQMAHPRLTRRPRRCLNQDALVMLKLYEVGTRCGVAGTNKVVPEPSHKWNSQKGALKLAEKELGTWQLTLLIGVVLSHL